MLQSIHPPFLCCPHERRYVHTAFRVGEVFGRVRHFRLAHKLKTGAVFEGKKIRAEVRFRIAISVIGCGPKIFHEEITGCFQVIHVQRNMFDFHAAFDLLMSFAEFVSPVHKGQTARADDAPASVFRSRRYSAL